MKTILLILLIVLSSSNCGKIADFLGGVFGDLVDKASEKMIDHVRDVFRESMDYLFDKKIIPLINQLEASAERVMDHAKDDIDAIVDNFKKDMEDIINTAVNKTEQLVDHTVEEIRKGIIDATFDRLDRLEDKVFQDLTNVLNKIDMILKEVSCYAQAIITRITDEIKKSLPSIPNPFEKCRKELDKLFPGQSMRWKLLSSFTPSQLYEFRKCRLIGYLNEKSPMKSIQMAYRDLELLAGDMRCLSVSLSAVENEKYYIEEMGKADYVLNTLKA